MLQTVEQESFVKSPIIFGDFMKIGAEKEDKLFEDLIDMKKLKTVLVDVSQDSSS